MGQAITVTARPGVRPDVMHFEFNRSLTGMQTYRYASAESVTGTKPPDELARRLFALGVTAVTVYSSVVTLIAPAQRWPELQPEVTDTIANLFIYYRDGVLVAPATPPAEAGEAAEPGELEATAPVTG